MKVLVVSNAAWPVVGGIEVLLDQLLPALRDRGHHMTQLTSAHVSDQAETSERHGITTHRTQLAVALMRRDPGLLSRERQRIGRLVAALQPDVIHAHDTGANLWAVVKASPPVPVVTTMHLALTSVPDLSMESTAALLRASAWVTGVSTAAIADVLSVEPSLIGRTSVIENGIQMPPLAPSDPVPGRILCVGRLVSLKGFDIVLRALAVVARTHASAHVVLAGDGADRSMLEALAVELGLQDRVTFLGAVSHADVGGLLASAQLVAMPSRSEGHPLAALEAGVAARPLVSTSVGGLASVVVDGVNGLLVPPGDPAALAVAMERLLSDPALCEELGANARARVAAEFSWSRCVDSYDELYRRIGRASN